MAFLRTLFDGNEREVGRLRRTVERVNALEPSMAPLSDEQLAAKTVEFRERLANGETLDALDDDPVPHREEVESQAVRDGRQADAEGGAQERPGLGAAAERRELEPGLAL